MKIFLGWSGERSRLVALALREWLTKIFKTEKINFWMSERDISPGEQWKPKLSKELATDFGIFCLTPENLDAPWIHFEAGVISSKLEEETRVIPYLIDLNVVELEYPFNLFTPVLSNMEGTMKLVSAIDEINKKRNNTPIKKSNVKTVFKINWPALEKSLNNARNAKDPKPRRRIFSSSENWDAWENAKELWLVGVSIKRTIQEKYLVLEDILKKGGLIRALLSHCDDFTLKTAVVRKSRVRTENDLERKCLEIKDSLAQLKVLQEIAPERLEIKTINYPLAYGAQAVNPNEPNGTLYIKYYPFLADRAKPKLILQANKDRDYIFFKKELINLWKAGVSYIG